MKRHIALPMLLLVALLVVLGGGVQAAPQAGTVHFTAAGDFAATTDTTAVLNKINSVGSDLTLALGDMSYATVGQEQTWCDFVTARVGAGYPFELVSGNHESDGINGNINDFSACLPNQLPGAVGTYGRQYYVDVPAVNPLVRFVMISPALDFPDGTYTYTVGSPRYQWTSQTIDGARVAGIPWVVVGMHKPCLTVAKYACDIGPDLLNLLLAKRVDLVLSGHDHSYQRSNQLALGGACTSLVPAVFNASCVVDSDSAFTKGAGSVLAVVATGGNSLYDITADDPEAGYFAVTSGRNQNPTWGVLDVSATADTLQGSFARASGGTLTDTFTITRDQNPPPNQPPVAAFTPHCTDLACTFDSSASSDPDPDDSIASYAWSFGDNATSTASNPPHTYSTAGTYPVTLTVTDTHGATKTATGSVTVSAPTTTTYADDAFSRTVSNGWGTAPIGGAWTTSGSASLFAVANGFGTIQTAAGAGPAAYLNSVSARDTDLRLAFQLDKQPTGSGLYVSVFGRRATAGAYYAKVRVNSNGSVTVEVDRRANGGGEIVVQPAVTVAGLTHAPGDTISLRLQTSGASPTTIRAKVWKVGNLEPVNSQITATDATAGFQTAGSVGVSPYLSSGAVNAPITVKLDQLTITAP